LPKAAKFAAEMVEHAVEDNLQAASAGAFLASTPTAPPIEVTNETIKAAFLRKATEELEVMPVPIDFGATPRTS
jgi:hypothetical protein